MAGQKSSYDYEELLACARGDLFRVLLNALGLFLIQTDTWAR